jgi:hypothetical protein
MWRYIIPLGNVRYLYLVLALAMILGFYVVDLINLPNRAISILVVICVLASISELAGHQELIAALILSVAFAFLLIKSYLKKIILPAMIILIVSLFFLEKDYNQNEFLRYKNTPFWKDACMAWIWLNTHARHDNISYVGRPVPFPLYGSQFKNNVYYSSVNSINPAKLHYFRNSRYIWSYDFKDCHKNYEAQNNYRGNANYQNWLVNLKKRKTDYLFVYSLHQIKGIEFPIEDKWADNHPEVFALAFKNDTIHIYKTIK